MEKILLQKRYYSAIFAAYFDFIKTVLTRKICDKEFTYNLKGVGQKSFSTSIVCDFDFMCRKISERIYCNIKYKERSKKTTVTFKIKSPNSFLCLLEALKMASSCLLSCYLFELVWGLIEALFDVEDVNFDDFNCLLIPCISKKPNYINPFLTFKKYSQNKYLTDDILCILYNLFLKRKNLYSFIKVNAEDVLILRGIKKKSAHYTNEDKRRICNAIAELNAFNLIRAVKIKKYEWKIFILPELFTDCYFAPIEIFQLNPRTKYFEKYLAHYIAAQIQQSKKNVELKKPIDFLYKNIKYLKPSSARERVENAFDEMVKIGLIKNWEYKKINENELCGADWIVKYKKLKIIFDIKNCGRNLKTRPAI